MQANHVRDKPNKLICTVFNKGAAPVLLADLILLHRLVGVKSGLSGSIADNTDTSQNNRRAEELSSYTVVHSLLAHVPFSSGTAVHVLVAATYKTAIKDQADRDPMHPLARIVQLAFVTCFFTFQTLAVCMHRRNDPSSSVQAHGYTSATRQLVMSALASLVAMLQMQYEDAGAGNLYPVIFEESGSDRNEHLFGFLRGPDQNHTGAINGGMYCDVCVACMRL